MTTVIITFIKQSVFSFGSVFFIKIARGETLKKYKEFQLKFHLVEEFKITLIPHFYFRL
jgi:hypothetical protein